MVKRCLQDQIEFSAIHHVFWKLFVVIMGTITKTRLIIEQNLIVFLIPLDMFLTPLSLCTWFNGKRRSRSIRLQVERPHPTIKCSWREPFVVTGNSCEFLKILLPIFRNQIPASIILTRSNSSRWKRLHRLLTGGTIANVFKTKKTIKLNYFEKSCNHIG